MEMLSAEGALNHDFAASWGEAALQDKAFSNNEFLLEVNLAERLRLPQSMRLPLKMGASQLMAGLSDEATSLIEAVLHLEAT